MAQGTALTDARIKALRPRKSAYDIRDGKLGGFGVRVLPSGRKRFFVHSQHRGERVWKIIGDAEDMTRGRSAVDVPSERSPRSDVERTRPATPPRPSSRPSPRPFSNDTGGSGSRERWMSTGAT